MSASQPQKKLSPTRAQDEELREFQQALQTPSVRQQLHQSKEDFCHGRYRSLEEYLKQV